MGEKELARRAVAAVREFVGKNSKEAATVLEWVTDQRDWLWPEAHWNDSERTGPSVDWNSLPRLIDDLDFETADEPLLVAVAAAARLLQLESYDRELLSVVAAFQRLPRLSCLRTRLAILGCDMVRLLSVIAGAAPVEAFAKVRRSDAVRLGLVRIESDSGGVDELELDWHFGRVLDEGLVDERRLMDALSGVRQTPSLVRSDFAEIESEFDLLVRLLKGAISSGAKGVNILIHGPPGTGKTEFARTLAAEAGVTLLAVGEADLGGDEPTRSERLYALHRAQRLLGRRQDSVLLFDEMEDLFAEAARSVSGKPHSGSKIFVNRLLENVAVPVIWTSNSLDGVDPAHLRRLSYVLRMDHPSPAARSRIVRRAAEAERAAEAVTGLDALVAVEPDSASVARVALRTAKLAGGSAADAAAAGRSLLLGIRGATSLAPRAPASADLALYDADANIAELIGELSRIDAPDDFSLLLTGPPGTGKTALAEHLARSLGRPLTVKRASDLLSKWVGETETNIGEAFERARGDGAVLLFDEVDSLLLDRSEARQSWEITQVNELLTWMDTHPLPFIAATNFAGRLDSAALRRFVFKVELRPLSGNLLALAFLRFFGIQAPAALRSIAGLTPGDFAVVSRQLRYRSGASATQIVALLEQEAQCKPQAMAKIGF